MQDLDDVIRYAVNRYVWQGRKHQLACACLFALPPAMRGVNEAFAAVIDGLGYPAGGRGLSRRMYRVML
jgi:hypothetical protein